MTRTDSAPPRRGRPLRLGALGMFLGVTLALLPLPQLRWVEVAALDTLLPVAAEVSAQELPAPAPPATEVVGATDVEEFSMVGVRLDGPTDEPVYLRVTEPDGTWGEWMQAEVVATDDAPDPGTPEAATSTVTTEPIWVGSSDGVQVASSDDVVDGAEVLVVRQESRRTTAAVVEDEAGAAGNAPPINARSAWGARAPVSTSFASSLQLGVVHHTASSSNYAAGDVPGILRSIQAYHMDGRGWSDIAYNFLIDKWGRIWEGRGGGTTKNVIGAHAMGFNTGSVGVSVIGSYDSTVPPQAAVDAVGTVLGWRMYLANKDPAGSTSFTSKGSTTIPAGQVVNLPRIVGHRNVGATTCPGANLYSRLAEIRTRAHNVFTLYDGSPQGSVTAAYGYAGTVRVAGDVIDPDAPGAVSVTVQLGGQPGGVVSKVVSAGSTFSTTFASVPGTHDVCVYATDRNRGENTTIGCRRVSVPTGPPWGAVTGTTGLTGRVALVGWAIDPDTIGPVEVIAQVDGQPGGGLSERRLLANQNWPGLGGYFRGYGDRHKFSVEVPSSKGRHNVCVYAVNQGPGTGTTLGCQSVVVK